MNYWFHPDAESEFNQAIDYYEAIETGLGYDFAIEVYATIQRSLTYPNAWPILEGDSGVAWSGVSRKVFCIRLNPMDCSF